MIREAFLVQNAFHEDDAFCPLPKQYGMLSLMLRLHRRLLTAVEGGVPLEELLALPIRDHVARLKEHPAEGAGEFIAEVSRTLEEMIDASIGPPDKGEDGEGKEP
jgi:V/A-type H+-transporting ATPase subunit A